MNLSRQRRVCQPAGVPVPVAWVHAFVDVPPGSLAINVSPQRNLEGWVLEKRPGTAAADAAAAAIRAQESGDDSGSVEGSAEGSDPR